MNESELLNQISKKLSALLAISLLEGSSKMTTASGERLLRRFELTNQDIADILGTTRRTIEVMKSRAKQERKV